MVCEQRQPLIDASTQTDDYPHCSVVREQRQLPIDAATQTDYPDPDATLAEIELEIVGTEGQGNNKKRKVLL